MRTVPVRPLLLASLALLAFGCPPSNGGTPDGGGPLQDPPQVTLSVPDTNKFGTSFRTSVSVSGCVQVRSIALYDHDAFLTTLTYVGSPTVTDLRPNQLPYSRGVAARLSLVVKLECADGRTAVSPAVAATFFPVADVISAPGGVQTVPDQFYAEGTGVGTSFIGCARDGAGVPFLAKVAINGTVVKTNTALPFPCTSAAVFSDRHPITGKRWMFQPGVGAMEYDSDLLVSAWTTLPVMALGVGPDGDAVVWDNSTGISFIKRLRHNGGAGTPMVWSAQAIGRVAAGPQINGDATVNIGYFVETGASTGNFIATKLDYRTGALVSQYALRGGNILIADRAYYPPAALSPDGTVLYVSDQTSITQARVHACATNIAGCSGNTLGSLKWTSPSFDGFVQLLLPYAQGSRIAAISSTHSYFVKQDSGQIAGTAITPDGAFVPYGVQAGLGRDFYILNGSNAPTASSPGPLELVGIDTVEAGDLLRYSLIAGSLTIAIADDGQPWLRINNDLVKPLALTEYRAVR